MAPIVRATGLRRRLPRMKPAARASSAVSRAWLSMVNVPLAHEGAERNPGRRAPSSPSGARRWPASTWVSSNTPPSPGKCFKRAAYAGFAEAEAVVPGDVGDDRRVSGDRALADSGVAVVRVDQVPVEIDDRRKIQIDPEARQRASLRQAVVVRRGVARGFVRMPVDDRRDRRLPRQRRRQARDRTAFLVGGDQERRQALTPARVLPGRDLSADSVGRKSFDIAGADEHAADGATLEQPLELRRIAIADDEMPAERFQLRRIGGAALARAPIGTWLPATVLR